MNLWLIFTGVRDALALLRPDPPPNLSLQITTKGPSSDILARLAIRPSTIDKVMNLACVTDSVL